MMKYLTIHNIYRIVCCNACVIIILFQMVCFGKNVELQAFEDHLKFHHLKQAIVIYGGRETREHNSFGMSGLNRYFFKFVNIAYLKNNTNFYKLLRGNSHRTGVFMTHTRDNVVKVKFLQKASENYWFNNSMSWFIVLNDKQQKYKDNNVEDIQRNFGHLNVLLNSDVSVGLKNKR